MPRRSDPAPGSVIAIAPTSSPRTSARHPGRPLLVACRTRARSASRSRARPCRSTRIPRAAAPRRRRTRTRSRRRGPPCSAGTSVPEQPGLPGARPELGIDLAALLPALVVRHDLALDPRPRRLAEQLVIVARPRRARTREVGRRPCARIIAAPAKWHRAARGRRGRKLAASTIRSDLAVREASAPSGTAAGVIWHSTASARARRSIAAILTSAAATCVRGSQPAQRRTAKWHSLRVPLGRTRVADSPDLRSLDRPSARLGPVARPAGRPNGTRRGCHLARRVGGW